MTIKALYPTVRPTLNLDFAKTKALDPRITFTRIMTGASVATNVGADGLIKTASNNVPRFDHDPTTGESLGLLVEEARTNLALYSETLGSLGTYGAGVITNNFGVSPSGLSNARRLSPGASTGPHGATFFSGNSYAPNGWQISAYVKPLGLPKLGIAVSSGNWGTQYPVSTVDFNSLTFTSTQFGTPGSGSMQSFIGQSVTNVGNGWYRVVWQWVYEPNNSSTMSFICGISTSGDWNAGQALWNFDGTPYVNSGFLIWGIQVEAGSFPTSYIPTSGSTVTRAADVASMTGTNFSSWYRQDEGTILSVCRNNLSGTQPSIGFDDATSSNQLNIYSDTTTGYMTVVAAGSVVASLTLGTLSSSNKNQFCGTYKLNSYAATLNSGSVLTDTSGAVPAITQLRIGKSQGGSSLFGTIARLAYYPARLPDAQLQALTAT